MPADVLFGYDESFLRPDAITSLGKLGELIRRNPSARFRIEGHTDSFGSPDYNARLSLARAESVKQWLAGQMAIDPARIDTRGLGNSRPLVAASGNIEEQQLNRRVEIVILRPGAAR
jgi:outer membrane protein OmpA-like peptidoglycan-associated protein